MGAKKRINLKKRQEVICVKKCVWNEVKKMEVESIVEENKKRFQNDSINIRMTSFLFVYVLI